MEVLFTLLIMVVFACVYCYISCIVLFWGFLLSGFSSTWLLVPCLYAFVYCSVKTGVLVETPFLLDPRSRWDTWGTFSLIF